MVVNECSKELKPCPFCGNAVDLIEDITEGSGLFDVCCRTDGCYLELGAGWIVPKGNVVSMWNNRELFVTSQDVEGV